MTKEQIRQAHMLAADLWESKHARALIADCAGYLEEYEGMASTLSLVAEWSDSAPAVLFAIFPYDVVIRAFALCANSYRVDLKANLNL